MPTIAGRQRPIEKFAEAVGKCGVEVSGHIYSPAEFALLWPFLRFV
jgi:hypothetical protein